MGLIDFRPALEVDVPALSRLLRISWTTAFTGVLDPPSVALAHDLYCRPVRIAQEVAHHGDSWFGWQLAEGAGGRLVGAAAGGLVRAGVGEVFALRVAPGEERQRVGRGLLDVVTEQQRSRGAVEQWVAVLSGNTGGAAFVQAHGFVSVSRTAPWDGIGAAEGHASVRSRRSLR